MKVLFLILSLFFLVSCGAKKLVANHADTFITNSIEKKLPLTDRQEERLAKDVDQFLMKKKATAQEILPLIDKIDPAKPTLFDEIYDSLLGNYRKIAADFSELLAKYIVELDENQQKIFFRRLSEDLDTKKEKDSEGRLSDIKRKVERLVGSLSPTQEKLLTNHEAYFQRKGTLLLKRKEALHQRLQTILTQDSAPATKKEMIVEAFMNYQDESMVSSKENLSIVKEFTPTLSLKQKEYFREKVRDLKEIIGYYLDAQY